MPTGVLNSLHVIAYMDNLLIGEHLAVACMHMWSTYMYTTGTSEKDKECSAAIGPSRMVIVARTVYKYAKA